MADAPESLSELRKDLKRALKIMDERRPDYELGREFYTGSRAEIAASKYVRKLVQENAEAMPVSLAHIPVDVIVDMIELTDLSSNDAAAARALATVTEVNDVEVLSEDWLRKGAYYGDYYVIVDPTEEDGDENITAEGVKWIGSSPLTTVAVYDKHDERTALYYAKVWDDGGVWHGRLYYDDCTVRLISEKGASCKAASFELDFDPRKEEDESDAFIFHPGERALVRHLAIDGYPYGTPLHRKAWGPQDAITKISASNLANIEAVALPARFALLDPMAETDDELDADFGTDGPGESAETADGMTRPTRGSKIKLTPGAMAFLSGVKEIGTADAGDGNVFLANLDWYVRVMAVASGIALFEFDLKGDQPSGESRRRAMSRALKKAKRVRRADQSFLEGIAEITLGVLGVGGAPTATFYPIETSTDKDGIELVALKVKNGVPVQTALLEAGYTDDQVSKWWPDDLPAVTYDILQTVADALAKLGTAKTLGVITDDELADMMPTILTAARNEGPAIVDPASIEEERDGTVVNPAEVLKAKADALGALIRSGADPEEAAAKVGLDGLTFPNLPVTVRVPESAAGGLEER